MPRFSYIAIDHNKKRVTGTVTAESPFAARRHLRTKGYHPTRIDEAASRQQGKSLMSVFKKSGRGQVAEFTKQLSTMINAGIKLTDALTVLTQQISDVRLRGTITDIRDRLVTGESFADALGDHEHYFDVIYISMVRVGEVTGTLGNSLTAIAAFMEKRQRVESKMVTAMIYPMILIAGCVVVILFMTIKIIPVIAEQILRTGDELPFLTKALVGFSELLTSWWAFVIIAGIMGFIWTVKSLLRTERGAYVFDKTILALPLYGPLIKQRIISRFASTLSTLLSAGLSMADSLKVVAEVTGNTIMNKAVKKSRERILAGADIATPLRDSGVIDPALAHMVAVGEKSGELETMLKTISDNLEASSDLVIERLSAAVEPLIIVAMAVIIGIIAYATLMPLIKFSAGQF
ncbi:MAG: type II secretion system F family protein [Planctomycetota bacterium]|jgi:type II secretory pathway component PulF